MFNTSRVPISIKNATTRKWDTIKNIPLNENLVPPFLDTTPDKFIVQVHRFVNSFVTYVPDVLDTWKDCNTTLQDRQGDCEDIAICKYKILEHYGFSTDKMFIIIGRDNLLKQEHAVLVVESNSNKYFVLDNVTQKVYEDKDNPGFTPIISFNVNQFWVHSERLNK